MSIVQNLRHRIKRFTAILLVVYTTINMLLWLFENQLVYPIWAIESQPLSIDPNLVEEVHFQSQDGTKLHGLYFEHSQPKHVILFFHGNGEDVSRLVDLGEHIRSEYQASILVFDYRGYGKSEGKPFERGVLQDGRAAAEWLSRKASVTPNQLVLWGRSLGGAVAVDVASQLGARGLILDRTFSSMPDVAARHYWFLPVRLLMSNRYNSIRKIVDYGGPLLQTHGTIDEVVPIGLARKLFAASPSRDKRFVELPDCNHNSPNPPEYFEAFERFLAGLLTGDGSSGP